MNFWGWYVVKHETDVEWINELRNVELGKCDVTKQVMEKISNQNYAKKNSLKLSLVKPATIFLLACLLSVASVNASTLLSYTWNDISIYFTPRDDNHALDRKKDSKATIEAALLKYESEFIKLNENEANTHFPFTVLRPETSELDWSITHSFGLIDKNDEDKHTEFVFADMYYDFFENGSHWVIVSQGLDVEATNSYHGFGAMNLYFVGSWEKLSVDENKMVTFINDGDERQLSIMYKNTENQVINVSLVGNVLKDDLIEIANAYIDLN